MLGVLHKVQLQTGFIAAMVIALHFFLINYSCCLQICKAMMARLTSLPETPVSQETSSVLEYQEVFSSRYYLWGQGQIHYDLHITLCQCCSGHSKMVKASSAHLVHGSAPLLSTAQLLPGLGALLTAEKCFTYPFIQT